jgi:hypothetical protein
VFTHSASISIFPLWDVPGPDFRSDSRAGQYRRQRTWMLCGDMGDSPACPTEIRHKRRCLQIPAQSPKFRAAPGARHETILQTDSTVGDRSEQSLGLPACDNAGLADGARRETGEGLGDLACGDFFVFVRSSRFPESSCSRLPCSHALCLSKFRLVHLKKAEASAARVVVISGAMWVERFGGDPGVIGRRISLDRES